MQTSDYVSYISLFNKVAEIPGILVYSLKRKLNGFFSPVSPDILNGIFLLDFHFMYTCTHA